MTLTDTLQHSRLALKFHPDKVLSNSASAGAQDAIQQFQKIGFAYAVLSDEVRRRKFDNTGSTKELMVGEGDADFDWNEYFKELWTGEVSRQTLDEFKKNYQDSAEEIEDILAAYDETQGDLAGIFEQVPCSEFLADEDRFIRIIDHAIQQGDIKATPLWKRTKKDGALRKALRQKAQGEAAEAEKLAKELGVWDDLFGSGKGKGRPARTSKSSANPKNGSKPGKIDKSNSKANHDQADDLSGLAALIQRKNQNRVSQFDDMIAKLEAKAGVKEKRPTDEEFDRIQADIMARKNPGKENSGADKKRASSASTTAPSKKNKGSK